ncbi:hypothetical protein F5X97DRAFT_299299 [Nemania serpens]|nr:hypothetical protein F5X97DRAFT_299299 [Nemania serpens]
MRIGCLQFAPQVGDVDNNLNRADAVLSKANPEDLDLLVLPELAFTGYNFKSLREISPFLEPQGSGISALWARTVALKLNCIVTVGYPEKVDVKPKWPTSPEYYNSVIVVNGDGETKANYRKTFLYYTDETWALEGHEGFYGGFIPGLGNTAMGICMDLNPRKFEVPWHAFEFAFHCLEVDANLVIVTMAWMTREDARLFSRTPNEPDMETLTYWISRLEPLIRSESEEEIIVIFCNRSGIEGDVVYAGTSAVIGVKDGEVNVYGILGRGEKDLLVVDTEKSPCAKLVYRPDDQISPAMSALDSTAGSKDTPRANSDETTTRTPSSAQSSPRYKPKGSTKANALQHQALLKEAMLTSQPQSPVSQDSRSSLQSHSTHSSKKSHSRNRSHSSQKSQSSQRSHPTPKETPASSMSKDHGDAPLRQARAGSDRSLLATQGAVSSIGSSIGSSTSSRSRSSTNFGPSKDIIPQGRAYQGEPARKDKARAPPIQIPQHPIEADQIPTPTAPSPTPLAIRPKLAVPKVGHKQPATVHIPTPHPLVEPSPHIARLYDRYTPFQPSGDATPVTAFDDLTPGPNKFFWVPSDTLLRTPIEPRVWTPARADSPTLSTTMPTTSQARGKKTTAVQTRPRTRSDSLVQATGGQPVSKRPVDSVQPSSTAPMNMAEREKPHRSDSPFANRLDWIAIAERLDALSPRPGSAAAGEAGPSSSRPGSKLARRIGASENSSNAMPVRPSSPKSRNASVSRAGNPIDVEGPLDSRRRESISRASRRIGTSASVLGVGPHSDHSAMLGETGVGHSQARAQSRGRQRPMYDANETQYERSDSARPRMRDNPIPGRRPSAPSFGFRSPAEFEAEVKRLSPEWTLAGTGDENEIIGEIIVRRSPHCVVHGRPQVDESNTPEPADSQGPEGHTPDISTFETTKVDAVEGMDPSEKKSPVAHAQLSLNVEKSSVERLSPSQSLFQPKTPKAMIFDRGNDSAILTAPLTRPLGQRATNVMITRPRSAVW